MDSRKTVPTNLAWRSTMALWDHLRQNIRWHLLLWAMFLAILLYFWFEWRTFAHFVTAIDHDAEFMGDFTAYYYPMSREILRVPRPIVGYFYTTFFALLLVPIGALHLIPAMIIWGVIQLVCLVALCIVSARGLLKLPPGGVVLFVGLCVTSFPILHNIKWGQVSTLITICVIVAFFAFREHKGILAGVLLAFAAAIKVYPAIFVVYFVLKRDIRACVTFGLAALVFYAGFPSSLLGVANWFQFEQATTGALNNAAWVAQDVNSQYIVHVGLRLFAVIFDRDAGAVLAQGLTVFGNVLSLSCIAMVWLLQRRPCCEKHGLPLVAIFLSIPFVVNTSWPHYFVYLPFCQAAVLSYCTSSFRTSGLGGKALSGLPILSMVLSSIFLFNLFQDWAGYNGYGMLFLSNALLLIAILAISVMHPDDRAIKACDAPGGRLLWLRAQQPTASMRAAANATRMSGSSIIKWKPCSRCTSLAIRSRRGHGHRSEEATSLIQSDISSGISMVGEHRGASLNRL